MLEQELKRVVKLTSHTQRNWDVSVPFPQPHTKKIVDFAINCPTKNGINYYDLIVVTDDSIKIGHTNPYSGPASVYSVIGKTIVAYFKGVNADGGINGRTIDLISLDDSYSPPRTVEQVR